MSMYCQYTVSVINPLATSRFNEKYFYFYSKNVTGGLASSKADARRLIAGKGIMLSELVIENPEQKVYLGAFQNGLALVRKGKRDVLALILK